MNDLNEIKRFYRVLSSPDHLRSWYSGKRNSYYNSNCPEWVKIWNETKSENKADYHLICSVATFTDLALENFIRLSKIYSPGQTWSTKDLLSASEVNGIYVFDNPLDVYEYGKVSPLGENCVYLEIEGEKLGPAPENNGYRVKFIKVTGMWYQNEFIKNFNLIVSKTS